MNRIVTLSCLLAAGGALALTVMNFLNNPVEAKRTELEEQLLDVSGAVPASARIEDFVWPFDQWRSTIQSKPKVWERLTPPPEIKRRVVRVAKAPAWATLLQGVKALKRQQGDKPKIIHPGNTKGEYLPIGTKLKDCELVSYDREKVTFSHYWPATKETRTFSIPRE